MQTQEITACGTLAPTFVTKVEEVRRWVTEVLEEVSNFDDVFSTTVEEVRNTPCDGFVPFTDGGFNGIASASMCHAWGSGSTPAAVQPYLDQALKFAQEAWDEEHPEAPVTVILAAPEPVALEDAGQEVLPGIAPKDDWERRQHPLLEEWYEFETESLHEGGTYFYKVRALFYDVGNRFNKSGKPEVYLFVGINTDFEYGRDTISWLSCSGGNPQQSQWLWERNVPLDELTEELVDTMIREAVSALQQA